MTSIKALLFLCISGFFASMVSGQSRLTDSLEQKLQRTQGKEKVDILNRLTYEFITIDNNKVIAYGRQALKLSKKINYLRGEARAHTYRGVAEYLSGKLKEGHRDLNIGLKLAVDAGDEALRGYTLLQLGNCSLEEVQNDSALFFFQESYQIFKDSTDPATLSKIYRNISALYGQRYQTDSQRIYLDRAIRIRRLLPDKILLVESLLLKANVQFSLGAVTEAEQILKEAEEIVSDRPEDGENRNDLRHIKALIFFQKGNFDEAIVLFDSARNYYLKTSLLRKYVTLLINLGKVFSDRGDYELALNNLYDGLKLSRMWGFAVESTIIRNQIGWINLRLGDTAQALRMANEAMRLRPATLLQADLANALTLKGVILTDLKDYNSARLCLDSVLHIYRHLGNNRGISETLMNLGFLEGKRGNYNEAISFYRESIDLAEKIPYNYGLAWSFWGLGEISFKHGDFKKSARFLDQSQQYAHIIGSNEVMVRNYKTRRDLLTAQNRFEEALKFSILANQLNDSIRRTDVARRFVNLEKIQEIEQRDRNIQSLQKDKQLADDRISLQEAKLKQQSVLIGTAVFGIILLAALALVYYRFYWRIKILNIEITDKNTRIQAQSDTLQNVNLELKQLYQEVSAQKEKIQIQANELTASNKSISDINRSLEKIVEEKTIELRTTNEELVKHNNELLQFSYTVSHNLRGPVARLLGLSGLAHSEEDLKQAKQWINLINKTAFDLDVIIKDLSTLLDLRNEPHQYREVVWLENEWKQSLSLLQDGFTGDEEIIANFRELPEITTVRPMLQSILYNLLSNAIKFRSPDRNLKVIATSQSRNGNAILEITDNGLGFDTQLHKDKMFRLYTRFHTHVEGRGLGLYLIKAQVEALHGMIEVESVPDRGSMFRVIIPLTPEENTAQYRHVSKTHSDRSS